MWADAGADAPRCAGSGAPAAAAPALTNGFPGGRALCEKCLGFVALDGGYRLVEHDTSSPEAGQEAADRAEWFNTFGWSGAAQRPDGPARTLP